MYSDLRTTAFTHLALLLIGVASASSAPLQDTEEIFPVLPDPMPTPKIEPVSVGKLDGDQLYVVNSQKIAGFVIVSPPGIVSVTQEVTPIQIRGKFVGGNGKVEKKTFSGKSVYVIESIPTATGYKSGIVEVIFIPEGVKESKDLDKYRRVLEVNGGAPQPPPIPPTPPIPVPKPPTPPVPTEPSPLPGPGFRVLFIYESSTITQLTKDNAAQADIFYATEMRTYLNSVCAKGSDGKTPDYRFFDKDATSVPDYRDSKIWVDAMKRPRTSDFWLIISDGKSKATSYEGPLPANVPDCITLLKKYYESANAHATQGSK